MSQAETEIKSLEQSIRNFYGEIDKSVLAVKDLGKEITEVTPEKFIELGNNVKQLGPNFTDTMGSFQTAVSGVGEALTSFGGEVLTSDGNLITLLGSLETVSSQVGTALNPFITDSIGLWNNLKDTAISLGSAFDQTVEVWDQLKSVGGGIMENLSSVQSLFLSIPTPVLAIVAAVGALVAIFLYLWNTNDEFKEAVTEIWNNILEKGKEIFESLKNTLVIIWEGVKEAFVIVFQGLMDFWATWGDSILEAGRSIFESLKDVFQTIWEGISSLFKVIFEGLMEFWQTWGTTLMEYGSEIFGTIKEIFETVFNALSEFWATWGDTILEVAGSIFETLREVIQTVIEVIGEVFKGIFDGLMTFWEIWGETILGVATTTWELIFIAIKTAINSVKDIINIVLSALKGDWAAVWGHLKSFVLNIWDGIYSGIKGVINLIIKAINGMINGMNKISMDVPDWVPIIGGKTWGFNIPNIPALATGTNYVPSDTLAFLHKGEAVVPKKYNPALNGGGDANNNITIYLDGRRIYEGIDSFLGGKVLGGV